MGTMTAALRPSPSSTVRRMTIAEFRALPEGPTYFEFEQGKLIPMPSPTSRHQKAVLVLAYSMLEFVRTRQLGDVFMELDVFLPDREHAYIPDISFLSQPRLGLHRQEDQKIHGAPDLVVEVISSDPGRDRVEKF